MKNFITILTIVILISSCSQMPWQKKNNGAPAAEQAKDYTGQIRQRLIDNYANILFCYERYGSGEVQGSISIRVAINKHGAVNSVTLVKDTLKDLKIKGCVIKTVSSIMFPQHKKKQDIILIQPFNFSSKS